VIFTSLFLYYLGPEMIEGGHMNRFPRQLHSLASQVNKKSWLAQGGAGWLKAAEEEKTQRQRITLCEHFLRS